MDRVANHTLDGLRAGNFGRLSVSGGGEKADTASGWFSRPRKDCEFVRVPERELLAIPAARSGALT
jgi:hypothetical protein